MLPLVLLLNGMFLSNQIERAQTQGENPDLMQGFVTQNGIVRENEPEEISYEEFLQSVKEQAENMQSASLFQGSYFNRKNIEKTQNAYSHLYGIKTERDYPSGLKYVTDYRLTDMFLMFTVIALLLHLMLYERTEGLFSLLKPTKNGRGKLICAKYLTMVIGIFLLTVAFYGTNYCIADEMNLMGRGEVSIQSVDGYMASPFAISTGAYLYLFFFCKWAAMTAVSSVFFLLCICCRNQIYTVLCITVVMAVETVLWLTIENYSWLSPLRQLNLIAVIDSSAYFSDYINFNFFGVPVSSVTAGIFVVIFSCLCSLLLSVRLFSSEASTEARTNRFFRCRKRKLFSAKISASLFCGECRKLFLMQKGLFLLLILLLVQMISYWEKPFFMDKTENYYQKYSTSLQGALSEEKNQLIKSEEQRFEAQAEELEKQYRRYENREISFAVLNYYEDELTPSMAELDGFEKAKVQYFLLQEKSMDYDNVAYLYQTGWEKLLGFDGRKDELLDFLKLFLILMLAFSGMGTVEKSSSVEVLIRPSFKGIKSVNRMKRILCAGYALIGAGITFIWRPIQIAEYYTLPGFEHSIQSILLFSETELSMSVGMCFGGIYLLKAMIAVVAGQMLLTLSQKCRQERTVLFLGDIILLIPVAALWFFIES